MDFNMKFSIIIPSYNREDKIKVSIESLLNQTYTNWECIVVDDGSIDNSIKIIKNFAKIDDRIKFIERKSLPKGANKCRNLGFESSIGDYIIFLDSDDELMCDSLERRNNDLKNKNFDFIIYPMQTSQNGRIKLQPIPKSESYLIDFLSYRFHWGIMCITWKNEFLNKKLDYVFLEKLPRFNDVDLSIRAMLNSENYKVFNNLPPDSIYNIYEKKDIKKFTNNVFVSLEMFIPEIVKELNKTNNKKQIKYLINFLHAWLKYFYLPTQSIRIWTTIKILGIFKKNKIIKTKTYLFFLLNLSSYSFFLFFKNRFQRNIMTNSQI